MKNVKFYNAQKYNNTNKYKQIETNIYFGEDVVNGGDCYLTSLSFNFEPQNGENDFGKDFFYNQIIDDICEYNMCHISDFYEELNDNNSIDSTHYIEYASSRIENVRNIVNLFGKHVYGEYIEEVDCYEYTVDDS